MVYSKPAKNFRKKCQIYLEVTSKVYTFAPALQEKQGVMIDILLENKAFKNKIKNFRKSLEVK